MATSLLTTGVDGVAGRPSRPRVADEDHRCEGREARVDHDRVDGRRDEGQEPGPGGDAQARVVQARDRHASAARVVDPGQRHADRDRQDEQGDEVERDVLGCDAPGGDAVGDEHERQVERGLHPGRDDAGADRPHAALEAVEREAGPGGLFPPVDEREGDDRAEDGAEGDGRIGREGDDRRGAGEDECRGECRSGQGDEGDDVPARADPEPEHPAAQLADAGAAVGEGRGDEGRDRRGTSRTGG